MFDLSYINVAILAGGTGTRLKSVVKGRPKALAEVRNRPFLEYILGQLSSATFKKVVLCTGYLGDQIKKTFGGKYKAIKLFYSEEKTALGTAGCLKKALPFFDSNPILVMNGDSYCNVNFDDLWQFHKRKKANASMVITSVSNPSRFGTVQLGSNEEIIGFAEKKADKTKGYINAGIYMIDNALLNAIPEEKNMSIEKYIFPKWIGGGFYGYKYNNNFIDIGTPNSYAKAENFFEKLQL